MNPRPRRPPAPARSPAALLALAVSLTATFAAAGCAAPPRRLDADPGAGFALYRSGWLSPGELGDLCREGLAEIVILDGTGAERECRFRRSHCPGLAVRYDRRQRADEPLSEAFLEAFDAWVAEARRSGRTVAFRCRHGWHRTGRLAAYYRMRWDGLTVEEAVAEMNRLGRFMGRHPELEPQVRALADHLAGRPCSVEPRYCVRRDPAGAGDPPAFPDDACPAP